MVKVCSHEALKDSSYVRFWHSPAAKGDILEFFVQVLTSMTQEEENGPIQPEFSDEQNIHIK